MTKTQTVNGKTVFVADFDTMPELPVHGLVDGEEPIMIAMAKVAPKLAAAFNHHAFTYAEALTQAIEEGIVTEPGKYGIYKVPGCPNDWEIYTIIED